VERIRQTWVVLHNGCNNNCRWCYAEASRNDPHSLSKHDLALVLAFLSEIGCGRVVFLGGEPTLFNDLHYALSCAREFGLRQLIVSNGRRLANRSYVESLEGDGALLEITISLEGGTGATHDSITRIHGSFAQTIRGIENCLQAGIKTTANMTLGAGNSFEIPSFLDTAAALGLRDVSFNIALPPVNCDFTRTDFLSLQQLAVSLMQLGEHCKSSKVRVHLATPLPQCLIPREILDLPDEIRPRMTQCHVLSGMGMVVDADLNVNPCTHLSGVILSNLRDERTRADFLRQWTDDFEDGFRKSLRKLPFSQCTCCEFNKECSGGCLLFPIMHREWGYDHAVVE
jgi:radical SAM protein with 4Fe4S-binding SPASM domain